MGKTRVSRNTLILLVFLLFFRQKVVDTSG